MSYFSIHNHTMFSIKDGFGTVEEMLERAKEIGLTGIAFTEHGNVFSAPYVNKQKKNYNELKVVYGVEFYECFDINVKDKENKYFHLIALAKNEKGRIGINSLITDSEFYGKYNKPRVDLSMLKKYADDLIITSACLASKLSRETDYKKCIEYINEYKSIFKHFYLEMQSHSHIEQEQYNKKILKLSKDTNTPFVITTDSHSPTKEMLEFQARHVQIAQDKETASESYEGCYLQSEEEIHEIMDKQIGYENVCKGLEETNKILENIEEVNVPFQEPKLPTFSLPTGFDTNSQFLRHLCNIGWNYRKIDKMTKEEQEVRVKRLERELSVIENMGFEGYFLIEWDCMEWGRKNGVEFNRGRGSGAGSIVCYLLRITDIDPIKYNLIFERFLNSERVGLPDIDTDADPKEKLINYLKEKYGRYNVCQVLNFSYITPCVAIMDTARVLDRDKDRIEKGWKIGSKQASQISKLFTEKTFDKCYELNGDEINKLYSDEKYYDLFRIAKMLSGRIRQTSTHAGGVCITDNKVNEYMPMTLTKDGEQVIQADKRIVEEIGMVKYDFLGLKTLAIINEAKRLTNLTDWDLDPNNEKFINDEKTIKLLQSAKTNCVFQVESQGMKDLLLRLKPTCLEDISSVLALYRPDSMGELENFIQVKNGEKQAEYLHENMKSIFKDTYGCMIYQEQMMEVVRVFGGRTYGGSDMFRKAIGKKNLELVKAESEKLYKEILENGYDEDIARAISKNMSEKGGYCFNKSHSLAYAVTTWTTAYLKANYPVEFFCAVLNTVYKDNGKVNKYILDAQEFGVNVLPPHINKSKKDFSVSDGSILFGLSSITNIGDNIAEEIIKEREQNGKYKDLNDLNSRIKINKKQMVYLIKSGALPTKNKSNMLKKYALLDLEAEKQYPEYKPVKSLPSLLQLNTEWGIDTNIVKDKDERIRLYNEARKKKHDTVLKEEWELKNKKNILEKTKLFQEKYMQEEQYWEFEALSIFLSNNPFKEIQKHITQNFYEIEDNMDCVVIGIISSIQKKKDRNKKDYAYVRVYESQGLLEGICWSSNYTKYMNDIKKGNKLAFYGEKSGNETFIIKKIKTIDQWIEDRELEVINNVN